MRKRNFAVVSDISELGNFKLALFYLLQTLSHRYLNEPEYLIPDQPKLHLSQLTSFERP